jgi:hypothetical protein
MSSCHALDQTGSSWPWEAHRTEQQRWNLKQKQDNEKDYPRFSHPIMSRSNNPRRGRGGQRPPYQEMQAHSTDDDFVMNEAERGVTGNTSSGSNFSTPSFTFQNPPSTTTWGIGDPNWGTAEGQWAQTEPTYEDQRQSHRPARSPLPPQSSVAPQPSRMAHQGVPREEPLTWRGSIFQNTVGEVTPSELQARHQQANPGRESRTRSSGMLELVNKV